MVNWLTSRIRWLRAADLRLMLQLAVIGVLVVTFFKIAHEVGEGTESFDNAILLALRNTPDDPVGGPAVEAAVMHLPAWAREQSPRSWRLSQ